MENFPNLFLIGAPKAGTSALADALGQHPDIFLGIKEPRFFDAGVFYDEVSSYPIKSMKQYLSLYSGREAQSTRYRLDASVFTMYDVTAIKKILNMSADAKFLIMLRDPLTASKSMHLQRLKYTTPEMREISNDFCKCWSLLEDRAKGKGFPDGCKTTILFRYDYLYKYELHLPLILELLSQDQIMITRFEDFQKQPVHVLRNIHEFLGIDDTFKPLVNRVNPSFVVAKSPRNFMIDWGVAITTPIRHKLGLRGSKIGWLVRLINHVKKKEKKQENYTCDEVVKERFSATYAYLEKLSVGGAETD